MDFKSKFSVFRTNWVNLLGIFIAVIFYAVIRAYSTMSFSLFQALTSGVILVVLYGIIFWTGFIAALLITDFILLKDKSNLKVMLLIEWLIISIPFIYWSIKYRQWIFLVAVIAFFFMQLLRNKILQESDNIFTV